MLEQMLEILIELKKIDVSLSKDYAAIIYRAYPSQDTQKKIEDIILPKLQNNDSIVYVPYVRSSNVEKKREVKLEEEVAVVDDEVRDIENEKSLKEISNMKEEEILYKWGSLKEFKSYLRDKHGLTIAKNMNYTAIMELLNEK